jgi:hypothetical protein
MPLSYAAVLLLVLLGAVIGRRRPSSQGLQIVTGLVIVIALFTVALVITYVGVIVAGQL